MNVSREFKPLITILRKVIALVLIAVMIAGCSYHGKLETGPVTDLSPMARHPFTLVIDDSSLSSAQVNADPQWYQLKIESGAALAESIRQQLSPAFNSVAVLKKKDAESIYDYIVAIDSNTTSRCTMNSCGITTKISMQMVAAKNMDQVILADDFLDVYTMQMPGSSILINLFTGISLFVLAPILQPISAHFAGKELQQRVTDSNDRLSFQVAKKIASFDMSEKKAR